MSNFLCLPCDRGGEKPVERHDDEMIRHLREDHGLNGVTDFIPNTSLLRANGVGKNRGGGSQQPATHPVRAARQLRVGAMSDLEVCA